MLTEAAWLLRSEPAAVRALLEGAATGFYKILTLNEDDVAPVAAILKQYQRLRPQLADAALVHLSRSEGIQTVFTLDRRDFQVYRGPRNCAFRLVP